MSNLVKRTLAALILAPLVVYLIYTGGLYFFALVAVMFLVAMYEWVGITSKLHQPFLWYIFGFFYIGLACMTMLFLERLRYNFLGFTSIPALLFVLTFLVWVNDIFSYLFGKILQGPKLWPSVSPGKTWTGAIGGVIACVVVFFILNYVYDFGPGTIPDQVFTTVLLMHILVPIIALLGDLFESWLKRRAGVKDSGNIIPGHGGLLDRVDGLLLVMNVTGLIFLILMAFQSGRDAAMGADI